MFDEEHESFEILIFLIAFISIFALISVVERCNKIERPQESEIKEPPESGPYK